MAFPLSLPPIGGYGTPSGSGSTPLAFNLSPEHSGAGGASRTREGSTFSSSRRSNTTRGGAGGVATTGAGTQAGGSEVEDDEEEEEGDNELDLLLGDAEYDEQAKERSEAKEALRLLLDQFSPEQIERYEVYRRSGFQKIAIRRVSLDERRMMTFQEKYSFKMGNDSAFHCIAHQSRPPTILLSKHYRRCPRSRKGVCRRDRRGR